MIIELYYSKRNDCLQLVIDKKLQHSEENIYSSEFFNSFGDNISSTEDLKDLSPEIILNTYKSMEKDFRRNCSSNEVNRYFDSIKDLKIEGDIIYSKTY